MKSKGSGGRCRNSKRSLVNNQSGSRRRVEIGFEWSSRPLSSRVKNETRGNHNRAGMKIGSSGTKRSRDDRSRSWCGNGGSSRKRNPSLESMTSWSKGSRKEVCRIGSRIDGGIQSDRRRQEYHWMDGLQQGINWYIRKRIPSNQACQLATRIERDSCRLSAVNRIEARP